MFEEFEESLARLGVLESKKTEQTLEEIDNKLYSEEIEIIPRVEEEFIRGYDSLIQQVDDKEIQKWQTTFHYFRVCGNGYGIGFEDDDEGDEYKENIEIEEHREFEEEIECVVDGLSDEDEVDYNNLNDNNDEHKSNLKYFPDDELSSLVITGNKIIPQENLSIQNSDNNLEVEEIIDMNGILEEVIIIDKSTDDDVKTIQLNEDIFQSCDPRYSQKIEIVNSLFDVLLPDIVILLTPVVEQLVRVCHENNINDYTIQDDDNRSQNSSQQMNEFFSNSDDSDGQYADNW